ncbi:MAG TPA: sugar phosphate isomerase/epimerase [Planctomycetes bacterium]|nr:sugar phosphate isomerase/epimerase [Planctomycetaceae bacterium]HIM28937.1 sugar phosphate isomerase/epimerase [Planctomycetota bacterium]
MSFKLCLNTSTIRPQSILDKIRLTAAAGFEGVELWINDVYEYVGRGGEVGDIEKALDDHGLIVPSMIALRAWGEASRLEYPIMLDEAKRRMELATRLGAPTIVCSPPRDSCSVQQITERYGDLLRLGREIGIHPTFEYISFFQSIASLEQAWDVVQSVGEDDATLILDAFHSWNTGSSPDTLRSIPASRISHYHIDDASSQIAAGQQTDPDRVMLGEGVIDLVAEINILKEIGYQGTVSLELFNSALWKQDPADVLKVGFERMQDLLS